MAIILRRAVRADLDQLVHLEHAAFDPALYHLTSRRQFLYQMEKGNAEIWVAQSGHDLCGLAVLFFRSSSRYGRLYSIAVSPRFQGGDVGRQLFECAQQRCYSKGLRGMLLEIRADNTRHFQRYLQLGYREIGRLSDYYPDGAFCIKMKRDFP